MTTPVLVLLGPSPWEGPLVAGLAHPSNAVSIVRRCLDTADLMASAAAGLGRVAVIGAEAARLDADVVARVLSSGVAVIGVVGPGDEESARRLGRWGAGIVVAVDSTDHGATVGAIVDAVARVTASVAIEPGAGEQEEGQGSLVAVWGPAGAPGRTSVAVALADEAARLGVSALLVDADTWAASVTMVLGVVDDGAGLASACRRAMAGTLDEDALLALCRRIGDGFSVLPGLPRAGRWTEVRSAAFTEVLAVACRCADVVVVDCGFSLEADEELVFDTEAPRRNASTFVALESADVVVAVGSADPVGLVRLVSGLSELDDTVPGVRREVVVTRVRESLLGRRAEAQVSEALRRHSGVESAWCVPDDRAAYDAALRAGRTLADTAPSSAARAALRGLTVDVLRTLGLRGGLTSVGRA